MAEPGELIGTTCSAGESRSLPEPEPQGREMTAIGPKALETLRAICGVLPESFETMTFGHPTFQAGKKRTFVVLDDHEQPGMLCLVFKADRAEQTRLLGGERFFPCKFCPKPRWASVPVHSS